jgi:hypothetical protein
MRISHIQNFVIFDDGNDLKTGLLLETDGTLDHAHYPFIYF